MEIGTKTIILTVLRYIVTQCIFLFFHNYYVFYNIAFIFLHRSGYGRVDWFLTKKNQNETDKQTNQQQQINNQNQIFELCKMSLLTLAYCASEFKEIKFIYENAEKIFKKEVFPTNLVVIVKNK